MNETLITVVVNEQWRGSGVGRFGTFAVAPDGQFHLIAGEPCNWAKRAIDELLASGKDSIEHSFNQYDSYSAKLS